jgi:hypothetical protein
MYSRRGGKETPFPFSSIIQTLDIGSDQHFVEIPYMAGSTSRAQ